LGGEIADQFSKVGSVSLVSHNRNPKFSGSIKFDFFQDDIKKIFKEKEVSIVFLPAKIEFIEDRELLKNAMRRFLVGCQGKRIVYISSDGIFDGEKGMYLENEIPRPVTLYGKNLELCEKLVQEFSDNYLIVRPSYIFGYSGGKLDSRLSKAVEAIKRGENIERFTNMYKSPLGVKQVAEVIVKLSLSGYKGIVHVAGPRMSVYEFFKEGLEAMKISTKNLIGVPMPKERSIDFLADTSLDYSLMEKLTNVIPTGVRETLL